MTTTHLHIQKNIIQNSTINAQTVHVGDKIYYTFEKEKNAPTTLLLRIQKEQNTYTGQLELNGKDQKYTLTNPVELKLDATFFDGLKGFENYKRQPNEGHFLRRDLVGLPIGKEEPQEKIGNQHWETRLGAGLFDKLFPENTDLRTVFEEFLRQLANSKIEQLNLVMSASEVQILNIPFEMMRQNEESLPLCLLYDNLLVSRSQIQNLEDFELSVIEGIALPLRVLFVAALPWNVDGQMIDLEAEQERIFQAIETANQHIIHALGDLPTGKRIVIEFLEIGSLSEIQRALKEGKHHILHFSGHGLFFDTEGKGFLNLENEEGSLAQISGEELAKNLRPFKKYLKLVIFAACETARAEVSGIAGALIALGTPAIIAMRYPVSDKAATLFTSHFYKHICRGETLSESLFFARQAIRQVEIEEKKKRNLSNASSPQIKNAIEEWYTPVLFLNQYIGQLVNPQKPIEEAHYFFQNHRTAFFFKGVKNEKLQRTTAKLVAQGFVGRRRQLAQLTNLFKKQQRYICIHGIGGIGKTSLAARFLDNYHNKGFQIIPLLGEITEHQILNQIAEKASEEFKSELVGIANEATFSTEEKINFFVDGYLKNQKIVLFFDNFEDNQGAIPISNKDSNSAENSVEPNKINSESLVNFLNILINKTQELQTTASFYLFFTTRYKIHAPFASQIYFLDLNKMTFPDTYKLLSRSRGLIHLTLKQRQEVHQQLGGHPRAIELLDSYFRNIKEASWESIKTEFKTVNNFLNRHDLLLEMLWDLLNGEERKILSAAAIFRNLTPLEGLVALNEASNNIVEALKRMQDLSLVYLEIQQAFFQVHNLTRQWILENKPSAKLKELHDKAGEFLLHQTTNEEGSPVIELEDGEEIRWHFLQGHQWIKSADITMFLEEAYRSTGHFDQAFEIIEELEKYSLDEISQMIFSNRKGLIFKQKGNYQEALVAFHASEKLCRKLERIEGQLINLREIGTISEIAGDFEVALEYYEESVNLAKNNNFIKEAAAGVLQMGTLHQKKGALQKAMDFYQEALKLAESIDDDENIGHCLHQIGRVWEATGYYENALECYHQSKELAEKLDNLPSIGISLHHIGTIYLLQGLHSESLKYTLESLKIAEHYQDIKSLTSSYGQLGSIYRLAGDYEKSMEYHNKEYRMSLQIGNLMGVMTGLLNIGILQRIMNDYPSALKTYQEVHQLATDYEMPLYKASALHQSANIFLDDLEDPEKAIQYYHQALVLFENLQDAINIAVAQNQLGRAYVEIEDFEKSKFHIDEAIALRMKLGDKGGISSSYYSLGLWFQQQKKYSEALEKYHQAKAISIEIGDLEQEGVCANGIATVFCEMEKYQKALEWGTEAVLLCQQAGSPKMVMAAKAVMELEDKLPPEKIYQYLKEKGLDIQYLDEE